MCVVGMRLKDGTHTNFDTTTNVFLLAVSSPILSCGSEAVRGKCPRES